jgi:hypothetical protein
MTDELRANQEQLPSDDLVPELQEFERHFDAIGHDARRLLDGLSDRQLSGVRTFGAGPLLIA